MIPIPASKFDIGDLYYFASTPDAAEGIWGIFDCYDRQGRPCLEVWSRDFTSFGHKLTIPEEYVFTRVASRDELRDFAYNMGYERA